MKLKDDYRLLAIEQCKQSIRDSKLANKQHRELTKIYKMLQKDEVLAKSLLKDLLDDDNYSVAMWAASHCLGLGLFNRKAKSILKKISSNNNIESITAKIILNTWESKNSQT
jgi:hypothetical protein